jgi:NIMA (never in mitosis gene a)-related kinase
MAPELCQSLPYSYKSDVWGLGCMFYEILTFKHAFEGSSLLNLVWKIVQDKVPPIPTHYSADVQALLEYELDLPRCNECSILFFSVVSVAC